MIEQHSRLTLIHVVGRSNDGHRVGLYLCECGNTAEIKVTRVKHNATLSCGCFRNPTVKHGFHNTPTYKSWRAAKERTLNTRSKDYLRYGGAGIGFSGKWLDFADFLADMGPRPNDTTLDRIDPTKGYEPGNCRWATVMQQARNRRKLHRIRCAEGVFVLSDYAEKLGVTYGCAWQRLRRGKLEGCVYER
jgi:hypothetical protein